MRLLSAIILLLILGGSAYAQQSTLIVSDTMYAKDTGGCIISEKEGWVFKAGNVPNAAAVNLDTKDWTNFKPAHVAGENLDKNGRFEGWFRIRIKIPKEPDYTPPGIFSSTWAASEIFINGKKAAAFGKTGTDMASFKENNYLRQLPVSTNLQPDSTYIIALHVVEYDDPFAPDHTLKAHDRNPEILYLTNKKFNKRVIDFWNLHTFYDGLLSAITNTLSLLFWILFGLNRNEKNIRRFAIGCTFLSILSISIAFSSASGINYIPYALLNILSAIAVVSYVFYIPFILAGVFNRTMSLWVKIGLGTSYLLVLTTVLLEIGGWILLVAIFPLFVSIYYLVSSWKNLKGAQWAIVTGFLLSFIFLIVYV
ncbi:hypothetical protein [Flavobacterium sp. 3HN19-14]|uniref:hypothetical protein n=1 Tax=Flavobacterium sp. 3HN19-14 TaxID=3448133 RepID=UPI003EDFDA80